MRAGFDWLDHNESGKPVCNYCKTPLEYTEWRDKDKTIEYKECVCQRDNFSTSIFYKLVKEVEGDNDI